MFSSALKSFTSNIAANYTISTTPNSISGAWKVYDGKKKSTGKAVSVFVFDRRSLEPQSGGLSRGSGGSSLRKLHDEVIARIKKEANLLARLRHPSILELAEPIEDTRSGGLMFATEPVTASLAGLLQEKDDQERAGRIAGRPSRFVIEEADGQKSKNELEIDELQIQKGLLQISQGLEFLHDSACLVHGNMTPDAIYINIKSDWKIAGFGFAGPPDESYTDSAMAPLSLSEVMYHDPRLPRFVQLDLDYTSPDFAMDSNISSSTDMFSLGLLLIALYNSPHISPIKSNSNLSTYKKLFSSSSTTPSISNNFLSSRPLPNDLKSAVLPGLITRRPSQRMNARDFQQSAFFDNVLVSSIRFLDALPAKTPNEKSQFMRGLPKILDQFPKAVLEKKVLPALLEETKDRDLLSLVLQNVFKIIKTLPSGHRAMSDKILPQLRDIFAYGAKTALGERDPAKEAGLAVVLENMALVGENCNGKEFKDCMLPIIVVGLESPTHAIVDKSLGCLSTILSILDFSSIKNELFPTVASVFSKTSSLSIKVRGLEAFVILSGGSKVDDPNSGDGMDGAMDSGKKTTTSHSSVLDKYTVQEKMVPLLKAMKTKEPAVMMAALAVFKQVGKIADAEFLAMEALPILWGFSLGPLLNLQQFQSFMDLIKLLSSRIEQEQIRKLKEISSTSNHSMDRARSNDLMNMGSADGFSNATDGVGEDDFERLVLGKNTANGIKTDMLSEALAPRTQPRPHQPSSPWQSQPPFPGQRNDLAPMNPNSRAITPDQSLSAFTPLSPFTNSTDTFSNPMPNGITSFAPIQPSKPLPWSSRSAKQTLQQQQQQPTFCMPPPPPPQPQQNQSTNHFSNFSIAPPPSSAGNQRLGSSTLTNSPMPPRPNAPQQQKSGLDAYESLL